MKYYFTFIITSVLILYSCSKPHSKANYFPLLEELHKIECDQVKKSGINFTVNDTNIYTFRGIAFDRIMTKDINPPLIAKYEDLSQKLAAMEYEMDDTEKLEYREDIKNEYLKTCN